MTTRTEMRSQGSALLRHDIRVAVERDLPDMERLVASVRLSTKRVRDADVWLICRGVEGELIGCSGPERRGSYVYGQSLAVAKEHRRQVIARTLIEYGFDHYLCSGDMRVVLTLFWNKKMYERLGFRQTGASAIKAADDVGSRPKHRHCMALIRIKE